jgi:hypothetical protein
MISGLTAPPNDVTAFTLVYGIRSSTDKLCTVTIAHNSISFVEDADAQATAPRCAAIANATINQYFAGNTVIQNNVIRMGTPGSCAIMRLPTPDTLPPATIISDNNVIYTAPGAYTAYVQQGGSGNFYETLEQWQSASGQDLHSVRLDPFVPVAEGMGTWSGTPSASNPDLHFTSYPGDAYLVPALAAVPDDYDRELRQGELAIAGADEISPTSSSINEWSLY